jgi:hypothetical protein
MSIAGYAILETEYQSKHIEKEVTMDELLRYV